MRVKRVLIMFVLLAAAIAVSAQVEKREIKVEKGHIYLNLPVKNDNALVRSRVKMKDLVIDEFTIKLAEQDPDFWVFVDVSAYQGKTLTLEIEKFAGRPGIPTQPDTKPFPVKALQLANTAATFIGQHELYKESLRPQVHFSARRGWINDPNGLIYYNGEYHLFFQHNPYGWDWGNMHWGHAVSKDLLHWTELKEAIFPVNSRDAAFSGSAVVDPQNTSGFRKDGINPLIAFYTSTGRGESIQLSYDNGRTFQDYADNPLIKHTGRDPKVFWYDKGKHWVMVVWNSGEKKKLSLGEEAIINQHHIYTSNDLKTWTLTSGVSGFFECPELFELPVENQPGQSRWIMYDATGRYIVGDFDGKKFTTQQPLTQYDYAGGYFYASQTFNNTPDNRRIQIGWGRNIKHPGMPFNQSMLFPVELKLKHTATGYRLCPTPIMEIVSLHTNSQEVVNKVLKTETPVQTNVLGDVLHVKAVFEKGDATFGLNVLGYEIVYNDLLGEFTTALNPKHNTTPAGPQAIFSGPAIPPITTTIYYSEKEKFTLEVIVDKNIIEIFVNDGELYFAAPYDGNKTNIVEAFVKGRGNRKSILQKMEVHELKSIWPASTIPTNTSSKK